VILRRRVDEFATFWSLSRVEDLKVRCGGIESRQTKTANAGSAAPLTTGPSVEPHPHPPVLAESFQFNMPL